MKYPVLIFSLAVLCIASFGALAAGNDKALSLLRPADLTDLTASSLDSSNDKFYVYDSSAENVKDVLVPSIFTTTSTAAELNLLDGLTGTTATIEAVTANPGRDQFNICGEATTVNNNTVYYGPDITLSADGLTCDINATGNTTEATADAPAYTNQAVQVLGMACRNEGDANADISFTLRTAAGATVPSVTCTIADGERDCVADIQTTTAIAAGATVAVAAASSGRYR